MTNREAINIIKGLIRTAELGYNSNPLSKESEHTATKALELAISALEKQIPEKPKPMLGIHGEKQLECGNCGGDVEEINNYCPWCGQALG